MPNSRNFELPLALILDIVYISAMVKLDRTQLSGYRSKIRNLVKLIEKRAFDFCSLDPLVRGSPGNVFRKCGEPTCKCRNGGDDRHGPYKVIQVFNEGKHKQISVPKHKEELWDQATEWQVQKKHFAELKGAFQKLEGLVDEILERRLEDTE